MWLCCICQVKGRPSQNMWRTSLALQLKIWNIKPNSLQNTFTTNCKIDSPTPSKNQTPWKLRIVGLTGQLMQIWTNGLMGVSLNHYGYVDKCSQHVVNIFNRRLAKFFVSTTVFCNCWFIMIFSLINPGTSFQITSYQKFLWNMKFYATWLILMKCI